MKHIFINIFLLFLLFTSSKIIAQNSYYIYLKDKNGVRFDPYTYFDEKAIERRLSNGINLYDSTDFPINNEYYHTIEKFSQEIIGHSRWFNVIAISATESQISEISNMPFVKKIEEINSQAFVTSNNNFEIDSLSLAEVSNALSAQLIRMQGNLFEKNRIDGSGIRIAVFDGGFPDVNVHPAFEHLRKNNKIIKTYNFPKKIENVYGWNSHGTMVLSCIAGIMDNTKIGIATGAEFLLARTEINPEVAKEEIWWLMAAEWADKNGADIISSSLGYGIDRHYPYEMDGKTCLVTRAANMAASKGILVVNSMGNEATKKAWQTLIAPADADSVLSVGGIYPEDNSHISFSSLGPTADGRLKPNVSAYGTAMVAKPNGKFSYASGTSFSCPLVAGFAACAWQTKRNLNNMQLKHEIEKSADMYPYFDYELGYGVPQAYYFINAEKKPIEKTFYFEQDSNFVCIVALQKIQVFYHIQKNDGTLKFYDNKIINMVNSDRIKINKSILEPNTIIRAYAEGYVDSIRIHDLNYFDTENNFEDKSKFNISKNGTNSSYLWQFQISINYPIPNNSIYNISIIKSPNRIFGFSFLKYIKKYYSIGLFAGYSNIKTEYINLNQTFASESLIAETNYSVQNDINLDIFQRFRLLPGGIIGHGIYLETGFFTNYTFNSKLIAISETGNIKQQIIRKNPGLNTKFTYGLRAEIGWDIISLQVLYKLNDQYIENRKNNNLYIGIGLKIPLAF